MRLPRIWLLTMPEDPRGPVEPIERALADCPPGEAGVQLRAKESSDRDILRWGRALREVTRRHQCPLLVNGRVDLAMLVEADGVHLPERNVGIDAVRALSQKPLFVGHSCHDRYALERARDAGADFAFLSPLFEVPGKAPPIGIEGFASAIDGVGIPTFALGGIEPMHVGPAIRGGAAGIALRRPIYRDSPSTSLAAYRHEFDKHSKTRA